MTRLNEAITNILGMMRQLIYGMKQFSDGYILVSNVFSHTNSPLLHLQRYQCACHAPHNAKTNLLLPVHHPSHDGSFKLSVAIKSASRPIPKQTIVPTFQVKEHVGLIVLEHLRDEFDIHILDIDFLQGVSTILHYNLRQVSQILVDCRSTA